MWCKKKWILYFDCYYIFLKKNYHHQFFINTGTEKGRVGIIGCGFSVDLLTHGQGKTEIFQKFKKKQLYETLEQREHQRESIRNNIS